MIEIVCPSCGAHYQVPEDSIGPEGRKVTCSNCSHKWRAYRETVGAEGAADGAAGGAAEGAASAEAGGAAAPEWRSAEAAPDAGESRAETRDETRDETRPAETAAAPAPDAESAEEPPAPSPDEMPPGQSPGEPPQAGGREEQMDAIRRMLDDLKRTSEDEPEPEPGPAAARQTARPEPSRRRDDEDDDDRADVDPLKSRIAQMDKSGKGAVQPSSYDAAKLRRMHEKRAKRLQRAKERQRKSGAFVTGFTLVATVAAAMVVLYVMQPQIVASQPQMAPAMNEYVVAVDRYRVALDQATAGWRAWLEENAASLLGGGDQAEGGGQTQGQSGAEPAASQ